MIASIVQQVLIICLSSIVVNQEVVKAQDCPQTGNKNGLPSFKDYDPEDCDIIIQSQAIIPSYKFDCDQMCGNITKWGVDVHRGDGRHQNRYTLDLQVWRPSPTVDDSTGTGQYSLVGNNRFTSISLSDGVAIVTPSSQDYIQFQPGDVLGFYVDGPHGNDGVVVLTSPSSFTSEVVWFASIAPTLATSQTTYSIGSSGDLDILTRAAPVISISTATFSCPPVPTPPPQPTTDSNETPPPTTQEPQQPTVPQETTNLPNNDNSQTLSNSEVVTTTGVVCEAVSDQQISSGANVGLVVGIVVIAVIAVTLIFTVVALIIRGNKRKSLSTSVPTDTNQAYAVTNQRDTDEICNEEDVYSYPEVVLDNEVKTNSNEAYTTTISTEENVAYYSTNVVVQENEAYVTNIVTETNEAYASRNISTENHCIYEN